MSSLNNIAAYWRERYDANQEALSETMTELREAREETEKLKEALAMTERALQIMERKYLLAQAEKERG